VEFAYEIVPHAFESGHDLILLPGGRISP